MTTRDRMEELLLQGPPYLDEQKPHLTVNDIAEELDVTKATVRNNIPKVVTHPMIEKDSVGQADVFWRAYEPSEEWGEGMEDQDVDEFVETYLDDQRLKLVMQRALWLHEDQTLLDMSADDLGPEERLEAWDTLMDYFQQMTLAGGVSFPAALSQVELPDRYDEIDLSDRMADGNPLPNGLDHLADVLYDVPLFEAPDGEKVTGIVTLYAHHEWLRQEIDEDTPHDRFDELIPSAKDIHYAGDVLDRLAVRLYGFDW